MNLNKVMEYLDEKECRIQSVRNRIVRESVKDQFLDFLKDYDENTDPHPYDWTPDIEIVMQDLGVGFVDNEFYDVMKDFVSRQVELRLDSIIEETLTELEEQARQERSDRALKAALTPTSIG